MFFVFSRLISVGQTYSSIVSDKEIYNFLNWLATNQKKYSEEPKDETRIVSYEISKWDSALFLPLDSAKKYHIKYSSRFLFKEDGMDTIFSLQDQQFIFKQFTSIKEKSWHESFQNSKLWDGKEQEHTNRNYYSIPLFSLDKKYVLIYKEYYCGNVCGYLGYYIYRRIDKNKWKGVRALRTGIS